MMSSNNSYYITSRILKKRQAQAKRFNDHYAANGWDRRVPYYSNYLKYLKRYEILLDPPDGSGMDSDDENMTNLGGTIIK